MSDEWVAGLFGLVGTGVGGAVAIWAALRQQRHEARVAEAARRDASIIAARILRADVDFARTRLVNAVQNKRYWSPEFALPRESWDRYREGIARDMEVNDWSKVSRLFRSIASFEAGAEVARAATGEPRPVLTDRMQRAIGIAIEQADAAAMVLELFTGDASPIGLDEVDVDADVHVGPRSGQ